MMKISKLIAELNYVLANHGDIECRVQNEPDAPEEEIVCHPADFAVAENYAGEWVCNIRSWPY